jgi:DNA-binding transcriptional regulator YiaG
MAGCLVPSPWGRIALLGIAQRTIHISRRPFIDNRNVRKAIPTTPKTLGDRLLLSRYERGLKQSEMAKTMGVPELLISKWERDICQPSGEQMQKLESILVLA